MHARTKCANAVILPFAPIAQPEPLPVFRKWRTYLLNGHPIRFVGERWRKEDAALVPWGTEDDPEHDEVVFSIRIIDLLTGLAILPASDAEIAAAFSRLSHPAPQRGA
jgi:hypothetical protein